ncbi:hypothetical protein TSUD_91600 [Trifolium subterraneum]|uniref:Riboflavin synthase n=1 Tax=Trifolium subterraneum TaxID=3900 RepID=A0A2Z6P3C1_TRISU|nr:hypothetical protein TSUD_91600 [Trifolium subterraneum]
MAAVSSSFSITSTSTITAATPHRFHHSQITNLQFKPEPPLGIFLRSIRKPIPHRTNALNIQCLFTGLVEEIGTVKQIGLASNGGGFDLKLDANTVLNGVSRRQHCRQRHMSYRNRIRHENFRFHRWFGTGDIEKDITFGTRTWITGESRKGGYSGDSLWVKIRVEKEFLKYIVPKGFIAVDGTSLTVVHVFDDECCFDFMLVAYTQNKIVVPLKKVGQKVNLEVDILGKYVERLLSSGFVPNIASNS